MNSSPEAFLAAGLSATRVLETLDGHGVHVALVSRDGTVQWASPELVRSRGERLIGGPCHGALFRRGSDCQSCRRDEVLDHGEVHRCWIPERRPGRFGPHQLLVQMKASEDLLLEAVIEAGPVEQLLPEQAFRERVLLEGLRHVPAGVLLLDPSMRVVASNPGAAGLLGMSEARLKGHPLAELLPEGTFQVSAQEIAEELGQRSRLDDREVELTGSGGARRVVRFSLAAVAGSGEPIAAAVAILTDVTRERLVGESLARRIAELRLLREIGHLLARTVRLDQVLRVIVSTVVHPHGLGLSRAALFLSDEQEDLIRGRLARQRPPDDAIPRQADLSQEVETLAFEPAREWDAELDMRARCFAVPRERIGHPLVACASSQTPRLFQGGGPQDEVVPVLSDLFGDAPVYLTPLVTQGRNLGVLAVANLPGEMPPENDRLALCGLIADTAAGAIERARLHDELAERLSDLRDANARQRYLQGQLFKAERLSALGELAAEIVHQIRNPLSVVGGFARRVARTMEGEDDARSQDMHILLEEVSRMESILERIRQDVRLARSPSQQAVDPRELLEAAVERYRTVAREQRIQLEMSTEPGLPPIRGSRDILLEALDNLIRNAFDAVPAGGRVTVTAKLLKEAIHLLVEDDGPGLTEEQISKIFEPFYTTKVRGTGLGLPLSQRLIRQCGGSLVADSRPGEGARFRIVMPVAKLRRTGERREDDDAQDSDS
jgi:hypothetical protein